jgi:hypothetical protein
MEEKSKKKKNDKLAAIRNLEFGTNCYIVSEKGEIIISLLKRRLISSR